MMVWLIIIIGGQLAIEVLLLMALTTLLENHIIALELILVRYYALSTSFGVVGGLLGGAEGPLLRHIINFEYSKRDYRFKL